MKSDDIAEPLGALRLAFYGYIASWAAMGPSVIMGGGGGKHAPAWADILAMVGLVCFLGSALTYLVSLGKVANRLGKSVVTWVGLTILTSPLGYLIAYPLIKRDAVEVMKAREAGGAPAI